MASSAPMRIQAGFTQDQSWQPLGLLGQPDPLFYQTYVDDFMYYQSGRYTVTATGNGSVAATPLDGGAVIFTTNSSTPATTDIVSVETNVANTTLSATQKIAFLVRLQLSDVTNAALNVGLIQKTTTPFTVTDGIVMSKASGSTSIVVSVVSGSTTQASVTIPSSALSLANNTYVDLGFVYDGKSDLLVFAGQNLIGQKTNQDTATLGPVARIASVGSLTLSSAVLAPVVAVESGTASSKTMTVDFVYAAKER